MSIQSESAGKLDFSNQASLDEVEARNANLDIAHQKHMEERREYLKRLEKQMADYLELNTELASRYRYLKYYMYNHKLDLMRKIDDKLSAYASVNDKRKIQSLQERMHFALKDFLNYKSNLNSINKKRNRRIIFNFCFIRFNSKLNTVKTTIFS